MSVGDAIANSKALDAAVSELAAITGQKPIVTKAKKSIAAFKLREGMNIGAKVTLRGERMYVFLDKLFNVVLPRIRDFRGLPAQVVRRARKLQPRSARAAGFSGDQLRQGRQGARHGRRRS